MPSSAALVTQLFAQLLIILVVCRVVGHVLRYAGQTQVMGEMVAGVLLGPSLLGLLAPGLQQALFPTVLTLRAGDAVIMPAHPSMQILYALAQLGLVLFMFVIGLQFNTDLIARHVRRAGAISLSGILVPLALGSGVGLLFPRDGSLFATGVQPWQGALFMGAAMAVTAFPVLARIIHDNGLTDTRIGALALASAAFDDVTAWSLLAIVLATGANSPAVALLAIGGGLGYALGMIYLGRPLLRALERVAMRGAEVRPEALAALLVALLACAIFTEQVGIHAVFGAFVAGAVMPRGRFADEVARSIERLTAVILLPIFFVYSGLNTQVGLLLEPGLLWVAAVVVLVAFACKAGACTVATRLSGADWREAAGIGALMNARGLMELVLINVGRDRGLISPGLFAILVLMTIITTAAATPLFRLTLRAPAPGVPDQPLGA